MTATLSLLVHVPALPVLSTSTSTTTFGALPSPNGPHPVPPFASASSSPAAACSSWTIRLHRILATISTILLHLVLILETRQRREDTVRPQTMRTTTTPCPCPHRVARVVCGKRRRT
jgi:hypothetical protein